MIRKTLTLLIILPLFSVLAMADERGGFYAAATLTYSGHSGMANQYVETSDCDFSCEDGQARFNDADKLSLSSGPGFEFRLGALIRPQHLFYLSWSELYFGQDEYNVDKNLTLISAGYSYYLSPEFGSVYLESSMGHGVINFAKEDSEVHNDSSPGAVSFGLGYELNRFIEVGLFYNFLSTNRNIFNSFLVGGDDEPGTYYDVHSYGVKFSIKSLRPFR